MLEQLNRAVSVFGAALERRRPALCPELELWLLGEELDLERSIPALLALDDAPYWAFAWGSGQALARHLLDRPELVKGKRVIDVGAGSGVAAIAAKLAGAREVIAVDRDKDAIRASLMNAALNGAAIEAAPELPELSSDDDLLIAADILYEPESAEWFRGLIGEGAPIILADPGRPGHEPLSIAPAASYRARTLPDVDLPIERAWVYEIGLG